MKNSVALSLTTARDGSVTGNLYLFFNVTLTSLKPADVNLELNARGIKKFAFMAAESGVECSFPLTAGNLISILPLAESDAEECFLQNLESDFGLVGF